MQLNSISDITPIKWNEADAKGIKGDSLYELGLRTNQLTQWFIYILLKLQTISFLSFGSYHPQFIKIQTFTFQGILHLNCTRTGNHFHLLYDSVNRINLKKSYFRPTRT